MAQTLYVVAYLASATDPADDATGHAQIKAGQDGSGAAAAWSGSTTWAGPSTYLDTSGLSAGTLYATAAVVYDDVALTYSNRVLATETKTAFGATGALASSAASVAGSADRSHVFAATGALASAVGSVSGSATHITVHAATGALASGAGTVSGAAEHTAAGSFDASGALASQDGAIAGTAAHLTLHTSTGALSAQPATASGTAAHLKLHEATGVLESGEAYINGAGAGAQIIVEDSPVAGGWAEYERKRKRYERTAEDGQAERERIGVVEPKPKKQARPKVSKPAPKPVSAPETIPQIHGRDLALWIEMLNGDIQDAGGENIPDVAQMVSMRNAAMQRQDEEDMAVVITTIAAMV